MSDTKKIIKNSGFMLLNDVVNIFFAAITFIALAKHFGYKGFGQLAFSNMFFLFFLSTDEMWIKPIMLREISVHGNKIRQLLGNSIIIRILLALVTIGLFWLTIMFVKPSAEIIALAVYASIRILIASITAAYLTTLQAHLVMHKYTYINVAKKICAYLIIITVIFFKGTLQDYFMYMTILGVLALCFTCVLSTNIIVPDFKIDFTLWKRLFIMSWPLALTSIFIFIHHRLDHVMLLALKGEYTLGTYALAVRIAETVDIIAIAGVGSTLPMLSKYFQSNKSAFTHLYKETMRVLLLLIIPFAVWILLYGKSLIVLCLGEPFATSAPFLSVLVCGEIFVYMGIVNHSILIASHQQIFDPLFTSSAAFLNLVLNLFFIPRYGAMGAAVATAIAFASGPCIGLMIKKTRPYSQCMFISSIKPLFAASVMGLLLFMLHIPFFYSILGGMTIYFGVLYGVGGIKKEDIMMLKEIVFHV